MTIMEYADALRRRWWIIVGLLVVGALGGYLYANAQPSMYRSSGSVLIANDRGQSTSELVQGSNFVLNMIDSYVVLSTSEVVLQPVIDTLDLSMTPRELAGAITASAALDTTVITIDVSLEDPALTQRVAAAVLEEFSLAIEAVSPSDAEAGEPTVKTTLIQSPQVPQGPYAPNSRMLIALGAAIGFFIGVGYALVARLVTDHITRVEDVSGLTNAPVIGQIVDAKDRVPVAKVLTDDPLGPVAESVRKLIANLNFLRPDGGIGSFVVTSASKGESKSTLALSTALLAADGGRKVLLVDADLRRPTIDALAGIEGGLGLTDVLVHDTRIEDAVQQWRSPTLDILTSGTRPPNPSQLLSSESMTALVDRVTNEYDLVIFDCGPLLSVSDAIWLAHATDGAVVAARWGKTSRRALREALAELANADAECLGIVMTRTPRRRSARYEYRPARES